VYTTRSGPAERIPMGGVTPGSVLTIDTVLLFAFLDQAIGNVRLCAHLKPLRDPFQRHGRLRSQLAGDLNFLRIALAAAA